MKPTTVPVGLTPYGRMARISRPKLNGFGTHEGVLLSNGMVVHIAASLGIQVCSYETFSAGRVVRIEAEIPRTHCARAMAQIQILLNENAPYDLIANNCEIFARKATLESPMSPQVILWAIVGFVIGAYALKAK